MSEHQDNQQREPEGPAQPAAPPEAEEPGADAGHTGREGRLTIVGIGASAGGLAALQGFFDALPDDAGMAYVVVTHMDPERESLLPELLQKHTAMPVQQVGDLIDIKANHVYVIPPGRRIVVTDTHLDVEAFEEPRGQRAPIDTFFRSLAAVHRQAVAVILSGGGTDGAVGVKAIKEEGGLLMVQHPDEAEHDSMPRAAIATGLADVVLPVAELAQKLVDYHHNGVQVPEEPEALTTDEMATLYRILTQVQVHTGHDFSQYKRSTLLRRIQRRLQLNGQRTMDAYLASLRHDGNEARALFGDLLIGVTNFFRDRESWEALAEQVIPLLFEDGPEGKEQGDTVRVWSIGCATGEEAYSLAILLLEHAATLERPPALLPDLQVFASDLDDGALQKAREGIYPEAIEADVSPERLERWFVKEGHFYRVRQELRDTVLFASHSVLRDPPFSRLDLISCRNLLIYLNRELQENVFRIFHYALRPERYLFLGSAESAEMVHQLFRTLDQQHRLYQARSVRSEHPQVPSLPLSLPRGEGPRQGPAGGARQPHPATRTPGATAGLHKALLEDAAPPSVLVDADYQVLHLSETAGRYLLHPGGMPTHDLLKLVRPELQLELRTTLFQLFEHRQPALSNPVYVQFNGSPHRVIMAAHPHQGDAGEPLALVFFLEDAATPAGEAVPAAQQGERAPGEGEAEEGRHEPMLARLEAENRQLRERLQATVEEYESSNEELKAANEELQSINEEYRSTTEELETSKEELQSVNEELQTVNAELKNKLEEVGRAHSDLENLMAATEIATLFLDRQLRIQRYTASTADLFNVMPGDRGRPIGHLTNRLQYEALAEDARQVLKTLVPIEREVQDREGRWFLAQLRPYRTHDDRIDGVVLTFVDVNAMKEAEEALRESEERYRMLFESIDEGFCIVEVLFDEEERPVDYRFLMTNPAFVEQTGLHDAEGRRMRALEPRHEEHWFETYGRVAQTGQPERFINEAKHLDGRWYEVNAYRVGEPEERKVGIVFNDITERKRREEALRESKQLLESIVEGTPDLIAAQDTDHRYIAFNHAYRQAFRQVFGSDIQVGSNMEELLAHLPDDQRKAIELWQQALRGETVHVTDEFGDPEHQRRVFEMRFGPIRDDEGQIVGAVEVASDVTERKQAEEALRASEERLRKILQIGTVGVLFLDESGTIVDANDTFLEQVGYTRRELDAGALSWQKLTPPAWMDESRRQMEEMTETGLLGPYEKQYARRDGSRRWFLLAGAQVEDGTLVEFCVDIQDLKETKAALRVEKEYSEKIVDTVREGLLVLEPDLTVEFANESFYEMFAVSAQKTVGTLIYNLGNGQWDIPELRTLLEEILPEQNVFNDFRVEHEFEDVGPRIMLLNARRLDHVERILLAIEDITERERYEEQLRARQRELADLNENLEERVAQRTAQVEKLARELTMAEHEERGRIAQILHDDLQQQLYALQMRFEFLRAEVGSTAEAEIEEMEEELETAIRTARRLSVDLSPPILEGEGLVEAIGWLAHLMAERHQLQVAVEAEDSFAVPDVDRRVLLFQAVRELLFNVVKHAGVAEATVRLQLVDEPGEERLYRIDVVDRGAGFDPDAVLGPGARPNGRGLLHVRQRLNLIGGTVRATVNPDEGTCVTIVAPPHGEASAGKQTASIESAPEEEE